MLRAVEVTRYVTPLREGGSLPALVEADDDGMYVLKFRGAGQGTAALVAEVVVGELGRLLGVRVPELVTAALDPRIAPREPDQEVQDLLRVSAGLNLGMDYLPGAIGYDGLGWRPPGADAVAVHWLDSLTANVDRTWRNPNLLVWHRTLWAIDHGAALVFQHAWPAAEVWATRRYDLSEHALAAVVAAVDETTRDSLDLAMTAVLTPQAVAAVLAAVPDQWLLEMNAARDADLDADGWRGRYATYLSARLAADHSRWWAP